jgi:hypothetical protein
MSVIDVRDDVSSPTADPGLVHLASQVVQLLWSQSHSDLGLRFSPAARTKILKKAGDLLRRLTEDTTFTATQPVFGALPSPSDLETSSCLLEAWEQAALDSTDELQSAVIGDQRFDVVEKSLLEGQMPSSDAQAALLKLFEAVSRVAARRSYESPLHDVR